ncbi:MAG TPA: alkaline phosphatase family protein [Thermoanaerobaculia bacterium]|nr:alkaline phosphatase family protein [Thermoanaerobaculia bacterium]
MPARRIAILLLLLLAGCARDSGPRRILVLALDGVDPETVDLLISEGKLPNFARLKREGAYGPLLSQRPLLSPVVWTTIATGKTPDRHGIGHFVAVNPRTGEELPVTSRLRHVKALWNIFSGAGRSVAVVGWWATWPPEDVRGSIVSDHAAYHFLFPGGFAGGGGEAVTHPPELEKEIAPLLRRPADLGPADLAPFVDVPPEDLARPFEFDDELGHFRWALATAQSYRDIGLKLWQEDRPGLEMVYVEGTDTVSHLFGHLFRAQGLAGELAGQQRRYGRAVEAMYVLADGIVGDFLQQMDGSTTLAVLSDHGFELGALPDDPSMTRDLRRVSERSHRLEGILYLYGAGVKPGAAFDRAGILDVAPTLLALAGLPPGRDMHGRVLAEALTIKEPERIATYEKKDGGEKRAARAEAPGDQASDQASDQAIMEHLRSLGYLDARSPKGDRNLAAVYYREGRLEEAAAQYRQLVAAEPDDAGLRTSYAGVLGSLGRYPEAREQLERGLEIDPLNAEGHHNLAVIHEREGQKEKAIEEYRAALRYAPAFEPSRQALLRLTGSAEVDGPRTAEEQQAFALAEHASQAARRGDYPRALADLDAAARLAPRYPLIYQYRSNVAYLMKDYPAAIAALEKALALQPDNALYRENLKRLREKSIRRPG